MEITPSTLTWSRLEAVLSLIPAAPAYPEKGRNFRIRLKSGAELEATTTSDFAAAMVREAQDSPLVKGFYLGAEVSNG